MNKTPLDRYAAIKAEKKRFKARKTPGISFRYSDARAVACQQMELRYKPVDAPRTHNDLVPLTMHPGEKKTERQKTAVLFMPQSWEIMTERVS